MLFVGVNNLFIVVFYCEVMGKIEGLLDEEMPREKLARFGPEVLTDVELLAIILRVGTKDKNVIEMSREIIEKFNVGLISRKTYEELLGFKGISKAKACQIVSVFELSRRFANKGIDKKVKLCNSRDVYDYVICDFDSLNIERVMAVFVDTKNQVIKKEFVFEGSINYSIVEPRDLIKRALSLDASGFFLIHNHPSGDTSPSEEDIFITKKIDGVCRDLNLRFLDHLVVGSGSFYSLFDNDIL